MLTSYGNGFRQKEDYFQRLALLTWFNLNSSMILRTHALLNVVCIYLLIPHDDVINWKHFPRYWPFVRGIHPGEFPAQRPVTRNLDVFFDLRPNKLLGKQSWGWWFERKSGPLWRHRNANLNPCAVEVWAWIDKWLLHTLYSVCGYLSMLRLKLIHVSKGAPGNDNIYFAMINISLHARILTKSSLSSYLMSIWLVKIHNH